MKRTPPIASAPVLWPESTVVCIASGPSLTVEDVNYCRGRAHVIAVNDASQLAPWADVVFGDVRWWRHHQPKVTGLRYAVSDPHVDTWSVRGVVTLKNTGVTGLELDPTGLRTGEHSGYQAINLAVHLGARRIVLLGYDRGRDAAGRRHFFGDHPNGLARTSDATYQRWAQHYTTLVGPFAVHGICIVNSSRRTALRSFPCVPLQQAFLDPVREVAS